VPEDAPADMPGEDVPWPGIVEPLDWSSVVEEVVIPPLMPLSPIMWWCIAMSVSIIASW
jgi:hypothetical protein